MVRFSFWWNVLSGAELVHFYHFSIKSPVGLVSKSHSLRAQKQSRSCQSAKRTEANSPAFFSTVIPLRGLQVYHFNNVFIGNKSQHTTAPDGLCLVSFC